jgi:hypothetical protein
LDHLRDRGERVDRKGVVVEEALNGLVFHLWESGLGNGA